MTTPAYYLPGGAGDPTTLPGWATPSDIAARALAVLRLGTGDVDVPAVETSAVAALLLIDDFLDRRDDPVIAPAPAPLTAAAVQTTVRLYRSKDSPFGILQSWSESDIGPVRVPEDWVKGVESLIRPYAHRYGAW